jgi:hypothetical protein
LLLLLLLLLSRHAQLLEPSLNVRLVSKISINSSIAEDTIVQCTLSLSF